MISERKRKINYLTFFLLIAGLDYVETVKNVVFTPIFAWIRCVHVPILNDECLEERLESFNVTISSENDCIRFNTSEVQIYIEDNDCKSVD